ncbi:MAG: arginine--tRNA ligase [Candidatus Magasanikbacteria bacterium]|jgi:arginyl-tRNA synthetase
MSIIKKQVEEILQNIDVTSEIFLSVPPKSEMGDLAFACFDIAKEWKMSPVEVAKKIEMEILRFVQDDILVNKVKAFGPYVNFFLNSAVVTETIVKAVAKEKIKFGANNFGAQKSVVIEYPSNNTHKELHVGHLRNICIGNSLTRIFSANGFKITPINYINDFGAHVGKCLWGLQKFHAGEKPPADKQGWLAKIYTEASIYLQDHPELKSEVYDTQAKLEAKDKSIWKLFTTTRQWSLDSFDKSFKEMGVKHNITFYEQDVKDLGQKVVDELLKKGIATVGEGGAIIVDLEKYNLDIGLLRKSNGGGLYLTSDLGLAIVKNKKFSRVAESIHLTGSEQNFYFQQLFKVLALAGYDYKMTHIGYGLVSTPAGKMASRLGNVVLYDDVRDAVYEKVLGETTVRHSDWSKKKISDTARIIAFAAIKFEFLKHEAVKNVVFDPIAAASIDGFTGPYVLYTVARINSIVRKSKIKYQKAKIRFDLLSQPEEKALALLMDEFGDMLKKAFKNYNPSVIVKYSFDLAKAYNDFYTKHSVLGADSSELKLARLALSASARQVIINSLYLLGIETVDEM